MARGGARVGSGRKPLSAEDTLLRGGEYRARGGKAGLAAALNAAPLPAVAAPMDLPPAHRVVWDRLAPHALAARTLTEGTAGAFRALCETVEMYETMRSQVDREGLTVDRVAADGVAIETRAHPLLSHVRGMMVRMEAGLARFRLAPFGKELTLAAPVVDPFAEFDEPSADAPS